VVAVVRLIELRAHVARAAFSRGQDRAPLGVATCTA
jgi:hypothetical protein